MNILSENDELAKLVDNAYKVGYFYLFVYFKEIRHPANAFLCMLS